MYSYSCYMYYCLRQTLLFKQKYMNSSNNKTMHIGSNIFFNNFTSLLEPILSCFSRVPFFWYIYISYVCVCVVGCARARRTRVRVWLCVDVRLTVIRSTICATCILSFGCFSCRLTSPTGDFLYKEKMAMSKAITI